MVIRRDKFHLEFVTPGVDKPFDGRIVGVVLPQPVIYRHLRQTALFGSRRGRETERGHEVPQELYVLELILACLQLLVPCRLGLLFFCHH